MAEPGAKKIDACNPDRAGALTSSAAC